MHEVIALSTPKKIFTVERQGMTSKNGKLSLVIQSRWKTRTTSRQRKNALQTPFSPMRPLLWYKGTFQIRSNAKSISPPREKPLLLLDRV
jgi:hypothetical protein